MYSLVCNPCYALWPNPTIPLHPLSLSPATSPSSVSFFFHLSPSFRGPFFPHRGSKFRETRNPSPPLHPAAGRYRTIAMDLTNRSLIKPNRFRFRQFRAGINSVGYATRFARPRYLGGMWERCGGLNTCATCLCAPRCGNRRWKGIGKLK